MRYAYFASVTESRGLAHVAVAHTASDQAETVLSHLLRGTGLTGLAGIYPVSGAIIRPLLDVQREEVRAFLSELQQPWREDASNTDASRTRARIRHQLIPLLARDFAADAVPRLARLAKHAREDEVFWNYIEEECFQSLATRESSGAISLSIADMLDPLPRFAQVEPGVRPLPKVRTTALPLPTTALTRRLVRRIFAQLRGGSRAQLTSRHVDAVVDLATRSQSGARLNLPGVSVERIFDRLSFTIAAAPSVSARKGEPADEGFEFTYTVSRPQRARPASVVVPEIQRRFNLKIVDWPSTRSDTVVGWGALDFDRVHWPLVLRNWHPGDSFRPLGSLRIRKLKRLLLESRVPRGMRGTWPVLTSEGKVVWASGYPVAQEFAADRSTRIGLVIAEEALPESA
jgi:tRNA(Ile)-lysidine synthase